jgi:Effector-associated domain 1/Trypsin-like peptidase domain
METDEPAGTKIALIRDQFLQYLANGRYREAESLLITLRVKARAEHDKATYYVVTHLLGVCYQQEGRLEDAIAYLSEAAQESPLVLSIKSQLHLGKVYSQAADYAQSTQVFTNTLKEIKSLERDGLITHEDALHLTLPVLWRLGVEETISGQQLRGEHYKAEHLELAKNSPYQLANAFACRAILFGSGISGIKFEVVEESLREASNTYINAPDDETTSFAFRDKAFIGMMLLEAILDFQANRKFTSYIKLHVVRYYMHTWGILPSSEGFAEMIRPTLPYFPQLLEFLSITDRQYERWVKKQHDANLYIEARGYAAELVRIMERSGKAGYRTELNILNSSILGRGQKVFIVGPSRLVPKPMTAVGNAPMRSDMKLMGNQRKQLSEALISAFPNKFSLKQMLRFGLNENLEVIAGGENLRDVVFNLVEWAEAQGKTEELVLAARNENPGNLALRAFAEEIMLAPSSAELESIVLSKIRFANVEEWRVRMIKSELAVCRIEIPKYAGVGTGFLLGPNIVMTNYHVMEDVILDPDLRDTVILRFDYKKSADGKTLASGKEYQLMDKEWLVDYSSEKELDYVLLCVDKVPGKEPIADQQGAPTRGWLTPLSHSFTRGEPLLIIQHPKADPLKFAVGSVIDIQPDGHRVRYSANTLGGSSGSPCFTANWELVALHRAGERRVAPTYNEGVPFSAILERLKRKGLTERLKD